jgi:hypothetical protein
VGSVYSKSHLGFSNPNGFGSIYHNLKTEIDRAEETDSED